MSTFLLEIVTPERIAFSEQVESITVPGMDGAMGILPHHVPLLSTLTEGEVIITKNKQPMYLAIGSGFLEVTKEKVILLVTAAYNADEINEEEIKEAIQSAKEALLAKPEGEDLIQAQALIRRSTIALSVLHRRRKSHVSS